MKKIFSYNKQNTHSIIFKAYKCCIHFEYQKNSVVLDINSACKIITMIFYSVTSKERTVLHTVFFYLKKKTISSIVLNL